MTSFRRLIFAAYIVALSQSLSADEQVNDSTPDAQQLAFVRTKVLPLLEARCFECHKDVRKHKGGLLLTSRKAMLSGGDSGPAIVPGKPEESLLVEAVRYEGLEMPPRTKMPAEEADILVRWIAEGAHWPADLDAAPAADESEIFPLEQRRQSHWAWQAIRNPDVPAVQMGDWVRNPLDAFVLSKLEAAKMSPAPDADRRTLIRRLYFDLIGLPPSIEQVEAFASDESSEDDSMATVVDELLASPHFGERWARHWLDLVRYAETLGHEFDYPLHNAWRYRDYVIRAFNQDVPYDQFVREHVAGDLVPEPRLHPTEAYNESVIGTGFWFLCEDKHAPVDVRGEEAAKVDNQLDVFSKTFLGMTVACARCHDHKFDAISTKDYYSLAGFLQSSRRQTAWLDPDQKIAQRVQELSSLRNDALAHLKRSDDVAKPNLTNYVLAALEVIHSKPATPEHRQRNVDAVATAKNCDPSVLQKWVASLSDPKNLSGDSVLSLPSGLAQSDDPKSEAARWKRKNSRSADNSDTTLLADLRHGVPDDWFTLGQAFAEFPGNEIPSFDWHDDELTHDVSGGVSSATLSRELCGGLTSPTFELNHPEVLIRVAGASCKVRLVIDGYLMFEFSGLLFAGTKHDIDTKGEFQWLRLAGDTHRYQGHRMHLEFLDEGDGWFDVQEIRFANRAGSAPPQVVPADFNLQLTKSLPKNESDTAAVVAAWAEAVTSSRNCKAAVQVAVERSSTDDNEWSSIVERWKKSASGVPKPVPVLAITDGTGENERVFIRGSHRNPGESVDRMILTALRTDSQQSAISTGSGRLQLADQMIADNNPLLARVAVNRIWHHLFGRGIVESTDNFGVLGKLPSHPELLDHLAFQFRKEGWSVKKTIRSLVLSRTYRLSSERAAASEEADSTNQLFHRANIRRLQGEAVRDAILATSGQMDPTLFGPSIPVHLTAFMQGRGRPGQDGPVDGNGRRSIYIAVNRNFQSPFMLAFDVPTPVTTIGDRTVSNVPAQALIMLNNEFVNQQSRKWAEKLLAVQPASTRDVLTLAWKELYGRAPADDELQPLLDFAESPTDILTVERLTEICHALLNSKEFLFLR